MPAAPEPKKPCGEKYDDVELSDEEEKKVLPPEPPASVPPPQVGATTDEIDSLRNDLDGIQKAFTTYQSKSREEY